MRTNTRVLLLISIAVTLCVRVALGAQFPNVNFEAAELLQPVAYFDQDNMPCDAKGQMCPPAPEGPTGSNTVVVVNGYLLVMGSLDSGHPGGPLHVFDISDPRDPVRITTVQNAATDRHREVHAMPLAAVDGHTYVAIPIQPQGVNFWDVTEPTKPLLASSIDFSTRSGDYDNTVWQLSWSWPYLFASGTGDGVYVVDTRDPYAPRVVTRIPTSKFGGARVGPIHAVGNVLVASNMAQDPMRVTVVDVTDPTSAFQLATATGPSKHYSSLVIGDQVFSVGINGSFGFWSWSEEAVTFLGETQIGSDKGGYCTYQDGYLFCGQSAQGMRKVNVADVAHPVEVANAVYDRHGGDFDFATVLGNLVYIGNDHGTGSALVPHQLTPDSSAPKWIRSYPSDGATRVAREARVTVFLSDVPQIATANEDTFYLRNSITCERPLSGRSVSSVNALSIAAAEPLADNTTYDLVLAANGISDIAGNALESAHVIHFSTGSELIVGNCDEQSPLPPVSDAGGPDAGTLSPANTLKLSLQSAEPVAIGQAVSYRVQAFGNHGELSYRWNSEGCDDELAGTCASIETPFPEFHRTYSRAGHFAVSVIATDEAGNRAGDSLVQAVYVEPTALEPTHSSSIVFDQGRNTVWNVNQDNNTVTALSTTQYRSYQVPVGERPRMLALAPDGSVWVTNQLSDSVTVIEPESGQVQASIPLPRGSEPLGVAFEPATGMALVTLYGSGKLIEIDSYSRQPTREVTLGPTPAGIAVSADSRIFVTRFISPDTQGEVWEVAADSFQLTRTLQLPFDAGQDDGDPSTEEDPDSESDGRGVPNYLSQVTISPDGSSAWVLGKKDNIARGPMRDGRRMNTDSFVRAVACIVDLATGQERVSQRIDLDNRSLPVAAAFSPYGDYVYVLAQGSNFLGIYDAYEPSQHVGGIQNVGLAPDGLVVLPNKQVMVNGYLSRTVLAYDLSRSIDLADHEVDDPVAVFRSAEEPLSAQVALGKRIFYNAADRRMSAHGYMSCAVCHYGGGDDGRTWDLSDRGEGLRNTKSLLGIGRHGTSSLHWSHNFDEVQDFERDIRESLGGRGFMADADWNRQAADGPLVGTAAGLSPELDALAAYVASLKDSPKSPYRSPDGSLTGDALAGRELYLQAGCAACHGPPARTDHLVHDVGTVLPTSGFRLNASLEGIVTPTLTGIWQTGPYLHDGRAKSLLEVLTLYNAQNLMGVTSQLSITELQQLVAYLNQMDESVDENSQPPSAVDAVATRVDDAGAPPQAAVDAALNAAAMSASVKDGEPTLHTAGDASMDAVASAAGAESVDGASVSGATAIIKASLDVAAKASPIDLASDVGGSSTRPSGGCGVVPSRAPRDTSYLWVSGWLGVFAMRRQRRTRRAVTDR